jgi:hypothetical protein
MPKGITAVQVQVQAAAVGLLVLVLVLVLYCLLLAYCFVVLLFGLAILNCFSCSPDTVVLVLVVCCVRLRLLVCCCLLLVASCFAGVPSPKSQVAPEEPGWGVIAWGEISPLFAL